MALTELSILLEFVKALGAMPPPAATPHQPPTIQAPASRAEVGELVLHCYHPSGRFRDVNVIQHPWQRGRDYNATESAVLSIDWHGAYLQTPYRLIVAVVIRDHSLKAVVLGDNAMIAPNPRCALNQWVEVKTASAKE